MQLTKCNSVAQMLNVWLPVSKTRGCSTTKRGKISTWMLLSNDMFCHRLVMGIYDWNCFPPQLPSIAFETSYWRCGACHEETDINIFACMACGTPAPATVVKMAEDLELKHRVSSRVAFLSLPGKLWLNPRPFVFLGAKFLSWCNFAKI